MTGKMKIYRCFVILILLYIASGVMVFSGGQAEDAKGEEPVRIVFWDENAGPNRTPYHEEIIRRFHEKYPNIEVEYVGLPWKSSKQKIDVAIATDSLPDCSGTSVHWISEFYQKGIMIALDPYFEKWEGNKNISKFYLDVNRNQVADGKLYTAPRGANSSCFWYRSDWFKEVGLNKPDTYDDFFNAAQKLTDKSKGQYGLSLRGGHGNWSQFTELLWSYSGITTAFDESGKTTANSPLHVEITDRYWSTYRKYTPESDIVNGYKEMTAAFDSGVAGMILHNMGSYNEHQKTLGPGKFGVFRLRSVKGNYNLPTSPCNSIVMYKSTEHPEATWEYLKFHLTEEIQSYWNEKVGYIPVNTKVLTHEWIKKAFHINALGAYQNDPTTTAFYAPSFLPNTSVINTQIISPGVQALMAGEISAEKLIADYADALNKGMEEYKKSGGN